MSADIYFTNQNADCPEKRFLRVDVPFNFSNSNASHFLSVLGFDPKFWDADFIPMTEMEEACNRHLTTADAEEFADAAKPTTQWQGSGGCTIISCGRPEGYVAERCRLLLLCIEEAREQGATHIYLA